jgi:hypothetical protein
MSATATLPSSSVDNKQSPSAIDAAIQQSEARHKAFTLFTAVRGERKAAIHAAWSESEQSATRSLLAVGRLCAAYVADGLAAGIERAELVADCCESEDRRADEVSRALAIDYLGQTSGADFSRVSVRRLAPLARLAKLDRESGEYGLAVADRPKCEALISLVAGGDATVDTAAKIVACVDSLLGKVRESKPTAEKAPATAAVVKPTAEPTAKVEAAPVAAADSSGGLMPADAGLAALRGLLASRDTVAASKALGEALAAHPRLIGAIVEGIAAWVDQTRDDKARMVWAGLSGALKAQTGKLIESAAIKA